MKLSSPNAYARAEESLITGINKHAHILFLLAATGFALLARTSMLPIESGDYTNFLYPWYTKLAEEGFSSFKERFHNYSLLYMYLLYFLTLLKVPALYGIKAVSILGDFLLAYFAAKAVLHCTNNKLRAILCYALVILCPTVIINGAAWAQCDSLYTGSIVASLYYLLQERHKPALFWYAIAFCFKLQALFLFPVYLSLALCRAFPAHYIFWGFGLYLLIHLPALLVGARIRFVFWETYRIQLTRHKHDLSANAPSLWVYVSNKSKYLNNAAPFMGLGMVLAGSFICHVTGAVRKNLLTAMTFFAVFVPFVLPRMHERYFFVADILCIIYACYRPQRFFIPCLVVLSSLIACGTFISASPMIPHTMNAILMALAVAILGVDLWNDYHNDKEIIDAKEFCPTEVTDYSLCVKTKNRCTK